MPERRKQLIAQWRRWSVMFAAYGMSNGVVQVLGAVATFIYVRLLEKDDYAVLALCLTTMAFISLMTDLGLTGSLVYFRRQTLSDGQPFGKFVATVKALRMLLFPVAATLALIMLTYLIWERDALRLDTMLAVLALGGVAYAQLNLSLHQAVLRIEGHQNITYVAEMISATIRAVTAVVLLMLSLSLTSPVMATMALSTAIAYLFLRARKPLSAESQGVVDAQSRAAVLRYIIPTTPAVALFAMQDLIILTIVWVATGTEVVANVFALGRIAALFSVLGGMFTYVAMPRIANMTATSSVLRKGYALVVAMGAVFLIGGTVIYAFPDASLLLIGERYAGLRVEVLLSFMLASCNVLASNVNQINRAMGWIKGEPVTALIQLVTLVLVFTLAPIGTTAHVLQNWLAVSFTMLLLFLATTAIGIWRPRLLTAVSVDRVK